MAAPVNVPFVPRGANPGSATVSDTLSTAGTGSTKRYYFIPVTAEGIAGTIKALSTAVVDVEVTSSNPNSIAADDSVGQWAKLSTATTGVTGGAIVPFTIPRGTVAVRVNVTTALAGNQALIELSASNGNY